MVYVFAIGLLFLLSSLPATLRTFRSWRSGSDEGVDPTLRLNDRIMALAVLIITPLFIVAIVGYSFRS